ncbi:MAG TPA: amidohydrolase family protein [Microthrixaceae bacterium]|jgi:N-acyl-D-aspartate/D-glutamate deacylase|nr:amidohydrolase family protein [Microthrixaceae bacterium]
MADLIIRGGTVIDGTAAPGRVADVAITDGTITAVGSVAEPSLDGVAAQEVDADGLLVTPGFVDIHTHFDGQVTWDPIVAPSSLHGVTTIAMGNCGVGFAPAAPDRHAWLISLLEGVEDIPGTALAEGLTWDWETFPEYLDSVAAKPHTVDIGAHIPHAAVRTYVMGDRGADHTEVPTDDEIAAMAQLVGAALSAGAVGFATSRTEVHRTSGGDNIGTLTATDAELLAIADAMRRAGTGVTQLISDLYQTPADAVAQSELDLLERFVRRSGRPLSFTMQQAYHSPDRWRFQMDWVDRMVADGFNVKAQVGVRPIGVLLGLQATANPFLLCASYGEIALLDLPERVVAMRDPERRRRILAEHAEIAAGLEPGILQQIMCSADITFEMGDPVDYECHTDRSVGALARAAGADPSAAVYDLMLERGGEQLLYLPLFNFAHGDFGDLHDMITSPNVLFGLSDAGAHCGAICDASMTTSSLVVWSRDRRDGEPVPVEQIVHGHTQRNARHMGWLDRGVIAPGYVADLNVIDLDALACPPPTIVHDLPAGGRRLMQTARGYRHTIKSGAVTFSDGEHTGALPGELLRGTRLAPA